MTYPITIKTTSGWSIFTDAERTADGGVLASGNFGSGATVQFGDKIFKSSDVDSFVVKYTSGGEVEWALHLKGSNSEQIKSIATQIDGSSYITGYFAGEASIGDKAISSTKNNSGSFTHDTFIARLTKSGEVAWIAKAGGSMDETSYGNNQLIATNNGAIFTGSFGGNALFGDITLSTGSSFGGNSDAFIAKISPSGEFVWAKKIGSNSDINLAEQGLGIALLKDGSSVITGLFGGTVEIDNKVVSTSDNKLTPYVAKIGSDGKVAWIAKLDGAGERYVGDIAASINGEKIALTGFFTGEASYSTGNNVVINSIAADKQSIYIIQLNAIDGSLDWMKKAGGSGSDQGTAIEYLEDSSLIIGGWVFGTQYFGSLKTGSQSSSSSSEFLAKLNNAGEFEWAIKPQSSTYSLGINSISVDSSGIVYIAGEGYVLKASENTPQSVSLVTNSIGENITAGSAISTLSSLDPDTADTFIYTLAAGTGDTDNAAFSIDGTQLKIKSSPDYENKSSYNLRLKTTDAAGLSIEKAVTIYVNNINEMPTALNLSATTFNENIAAASVIATLSSADPDTADTFSYTLAAGIGDTDNAAFTIDGIQLKLNESPDFETKSSYNLRLKTTDAAGFSIEKAIVLNVININEVPTALDLSANIFNESIAAASVIANIFGSDHELQALVRGYDYKIITNELKNIFKQGKLTQVLQIQWLLTVSEANGAKGTFQGTTPFDIIKSTKDDQNIINIFYQNTKYGNDYKDISEISNSDLIEWVSKHVINEYTQHPMWDSIEEQIYATRVPGTYMESLSYKLISGTGDTDNAAFTIDGTQLKIKASPDFENKSSYNLRLKTTDAGGLSIEKAVTLNVNNVNEMPTALNLSASTFNENITAASAIATLSSTDPDTADTFTYSLTAGIGDTDNAAFTIDGTQLKIKASPDFETKSSYNLHLKTTDAGGLSIEKAVILTVTNLNANPSYTLTPSSATINEDAVLTSTVTTTNVATSTKLYYALSGTGIKTADFSAGALTGEGTTDSAGKFSFTHTLANDLATEGAESLVFNLYSDVARTLQVGSTATVTVNDTSLTPVKPTQRVYTEKAQISYKPTSTVSATLLYTTSTGDANLSGLTLNVHYNSSVLTPSGSSNGVSAQLSAAITSTVIMPDTNNSDNDPLTDKIIQLLWATIDDSFPNKTLPASLATVSFNTTTANTDSLTGQPLSTTVHYTASETAVGYDFLTGATLFKAQQFNLYVDVDGDGKVTALGDGLMVIRKLFGAAFAGDALTSKAISPTATRTTAEIHDFIQQRIDGGLLDVDKDGKTTAFGDGLMVIRRLFGAAFAGAALTNKAISPDSPYFGPPADFASVAANIDALRPTFI